MKIVKWKVKESMCRYGKGFGKYLLNALKRG